MVPEMLYVCGVGGGGEVLAVVAVTTPEQPQTKTTAASMPASRSAGRTRNRRFRTDSPNRIPNTVEAPRFSEARTILEEESTIAANLETLVGSPI